MYYVNVFGLVSEDLADVTGRVAHWGGGVDVYPVAGAGIDRKYVRQDSLVCQPPDPNQKAVRRINTWYPRRSPWRSAEDRAELVFQRVLSGPPEDMRDVPWGDWDCNPEVEDKARVSRVILDSSDIWARGTRGRNCGNWGRRSHGPSRGKWNKPERGAPPHRA